jgi:olefin beta-lactone synthetase
MKSDEVMDSIDPLPENNSIFNISSHLREMAALHPHQRAVVVPKARDKDGRVAYTHLTFSQLENESDRMAFGLNSIGITRGTRTILMVKPGIEFFILTFSLFKVGAVPVVVDPGMGIRRMLGCLKQSMPEAFIGIPKAHALRIFCPKYFQTVKTSVTVGRRWFWGGHSFNSIRHIGKDPFPIAQTRYKEAAAILFTTGSTGPAKGAIYSHKTFDAQIRQLKSCFNIGENEIDLPTFPLFALFDPALGMTAVIPDMDPTRPAFVNPKKIIEAIENQGVTNMFASPALLNRVGRFGQENKVRLPSLKRVVSAGAPVAPANIEQFLTMLCDEAQIYTPYGATEAVPVAVIGSREILSETAMRSEKGHGLCVGRPLDGVEVNIIRIDDGPIKQWSDDLLVDDGDIGEIVVRGNLVSPRYFKLPRQNALSKIIKGKTVYHRMGDLGWRDNKGRIWFCGRKSHRVSTANGTLFTIPCEAIFNTHPCVARSALVGVGNPPEQKPVICIELDKRQKGTSINELEQELIQLAKGNFLTENIDTILFHRGFPVDIRHNSKIFREQLSLWASKKINVHGVMQP